jgi:hypothetical protein
LSAVFQNTEGSDPAILPPRPFWRTIGGKKLDGVTKSLRDVRFRAGFDSWSRR